MTVGPTLSPCPRCTSNAFIDGCCASCGYNVRAVPLAVQLERGKRARTLRRQRAKRAACDHGQGKAFAFVEKRSTGDAYLSAERCLRCGEERLV